MSGFIRVGGVQKLQDEEFIVQVCESYRHFSYIGYILNFLAALFVFVLLSRWMFLMYNVC